jgi:hypothetical protein
VNMMSLIGERKELDDTHEKVRDEGEQVKR